MQGLHVMVGGGSGFIGHHLCKNLKTSGHKVTIISRNAGKEQITWKQIEQDGLPPCDAIIMIPGANIMQKSWTEQRKKEIIDSRIGTTQLIVNAVKSSKKRPQVIVNGSAIGFYPTSATEVLEFDETCKIPAQNFPGYLCSEWEKALFEAKDIDDVRKVAVRTSIVLGKDGGTLKEMLLPFKLGLGGVMGSGNQYWPWIHVEDIAGIFQFATENKQVTGVLNGAAPHYVTNREFTKTLGSVLNRPTLLPLPEFVVKMIFRERAMMILEGHKVIPKRTLECGYKFKFPTLEAALRDLTAK